MNFKTIFTPIRKILGSNKNIIESLAAAFTIIGIVFAGYEYQGQKQINREQKAFELYKQFNEEHFIKSRNEFKKAFYDTRNKNPDYYKSVKNQMTAMKDTWEKQYGNIISLTDFFEQVANCVNEDLCAENGTYTLFGKEAKSFLEINHPFFCNQRVNHNDQDIGLILENFVIKFVEKTKKNEKDPGLILVEFATKNEELGVILRGFATKTEKIDSQTSQRCNYMQEKQNREILSS